VIADRNSHLHKCEDFDHLNQPKDNIEQYEQRADMFKAKYKNANKILSGERLETVLRCIKMKHESMKRAKKRYNTEYHCIKKQMGWKSPLLSEDSLAPEMTNHKYVLMHLQFVICLP
jgi:hemoglobin-like flavoprotein